MKYKVYIEQDHDPINPRTDYDHVGVMYCEHRRYDLGDKGAEDAFEEVEVYDLDGVSLTEDERNYAIDMFGEIVSDLLNEWETVEEKAEADRLQDIYNELYDLDYVERRQLRSDVRIALPIYLYDHSGITISHGDFGDRWDSGCVGVHYITHEAAAREWLEGVTDEQLEKVLEYELEAYDHYLQGNVWCFMIEDEDGDVVDSCGGFSGDELEDTGILAHAEDKFHAALHEAWDKRFDHRQVSRRQHACVLVDEDGAILEGE